MRVPGIGMGFGQPLRGGARARRRGPGRPSLRTRLRRPRAAGGPPARSGLIKRAQIGRRGGGEEQLPLVQQRMNPELGGRQQRARTRALAQTQLARVGRQ